MDRPLFRIAAVAKASGLSADTIRIWERRYGLVKPIRDGAGIRQYSREDVVRLRLAHDATARGHAIGYVSTLTNAQLSELVATSASAPVSIGGYDPVQAAKEAWVRQTIEAIVAFDASATERRLNEAFLILDPQEALIDFVAPLLRAVGDGWQLGSLTIAHEHFASQIVRNVLGSMLRTVPPGARGAMLFAAPAGELHEFGLLIASHLAALRGFTPRMLGANLPIDDLIFAADYFKPACVVLGLILDPETSHAVRYVRDADARLAADTALLVGGAGAEVLAAHSWSPRVTFVDSLAAFNARVRSL